MAHKATGVFKGTKNIRADVGAIRATYNALSDKHTSALDRIKKYSEMAQNGSYFSASDLSDFMSAINNYESSGNTYRRLYELGGNSYTDEENQTWADSISALREGHTNLSNLWSKWENEDAYKTYLSEQAAALKEHETKMSYDVAGEKAQLAADMAKYENDSETLKALYNKFGPVNSPYSKDEQDKARREYNEILASYVKNPQKIPGTDNYTGETLLEGREAFDALSAGFDSRQNEIDSIEKYQKSQALAEEYASVNLNYEWNAYELDEKYLAQARESDKRLSQLNSELSGIRKTREKTGNSNWGKEKEAELRGEISKLKTYISTHTNGMGVDGFAQYLRERKLYLTEVENYQNGVKLGSVVNASDFEEYAQKGLEYEFTMDIKCQGNLTMPENEKGNDIVAFRENKDQYILSYTYSPNKEAMQEKISLAQYMKDDEVKIYSYYLAKEGKEKANEYFNSIKETLTDRKATGIVEWVGDSKALSLMLKAAAGFEDFSQSWESAWNMLTGDDSYIPPSATQIAASSEEINENLPGGWGVAGDLLQTTTNQLPSMMMSFIPVVGTGLSLASMGISASGNAYNQMISLGYSTDQARTYGLLVGGSEIALGALLDGTMKGAGKLTGITESKLLSSIDNAFARVAISTGSRMVGEFTEESLQTVLEPWFESIVTHQDFEAANLDEILYSGLLGALSAGLLGNIDVTSDSTIAGAIGTTIRGAKVKALDGGVSRLTKLGSTFSADTIAYKIANKVNDNTGAYTIGRLLNEANATLTEQNKSEIAKSLERKGLVGEHATNIVNALAEVVEGAEFNPIQRMALEANPIIARTIRDVIINPNSTVNQRTKGLYDLATDMSRGKTKASTTDTANAVADGAKTLEASESTTTEENATQRKYEVSTDGKTMLMSNSEYVTPLRIESIDNGNVKVKLDNGKTVDASELSFATSDEALLYEMVARMGDVTPETATALIRNFKATDGVSAQTYALDIPLAYQYGKINYKDGLENLDLTIDQRQVAFHHGRNGRNYADAVQEYYLAGLLGETYESVHSTSFVLSENDRKDAYDRGRAERTKRHESAEIRQHQINEAKSKNKRFKISKVGKENNNSFYDGDISELSDIQRVSIEALDDIFGGRARITFISSYTDETGGQVYKNAEGEIVNAPNGETAPDGSIIIDLNAGDYGEGLILYTASHEFTHLAKLRSPQLYEKYVEFLVKYYPTKKGNTISDEIRAVMEWSSVRRVRLAPGEALDEFAARASERMLVDIIKNKEASNLQKLGVKDKGFFKSIISIINDIFDRLSQKIAKWYGKIDPQNDQAKAVAKMGEHLEQLRSMWAEMVGDAVTANSKFNSEKSGFSQDEHSNYMDSATYQKRKSAKTLLMQNANSNTSKTQVGQTSKDSITQPEPIVNASNGTKFSLRNNAKTVDNYTEEQYNNFGWARYAEAISFNELEDLYSKIQEKGSLVKFKHSANGEAIIEVNNKPKTSLDVDNVFVFVTGTKNAPKITRVLRVALFNQSDMEKVRKHIYAREQKYSNARTSAIVGNIYFEELVFEYRREYFGDYQEYRNKIGEQSSRSESEGNSGAYRDWYQREGTAYETESGITSDDKISYSLRNRTQAVALLERYEKGEITKHEYDDILKRIKKDTPKTIANMGREEMPTTPELRRKLGMAEGNKESRFHESLQKSSIFDKDFKREVENDNFIKHYAGITNKETLEEAARRLDIGGEQYVHDWLAKNITEMDTIDTVTGFILLKRYQDIGNYQSAAAVAQKIRAVGTLAGQTVQSFSIIGRFTPAMMEVYAQKDLDRALEEARKYRSNKWIKKNEDRFKLTEEEKEFIRNNIEDAAKLPENSRPRAIKLAEINTLLQNKLPPVRGQSYKAWQRISMLLNVRTNFRNTVGNFIMAPVFVVSDWFSTAADKFFLSSQTGTRTKGVSRFKDVGRTGKAFIKGGFETIDDFRRHINTKTQDLDRFKIGEGKSFDENKWGGIAKAMNSLDRLTSFFLELGDRPFFEAYFTNSINNQMRLARVSEPTEAMIEIATQEALQRTWQDNNGMTKFVAKIKNAMNIFNIAGYGLGDVFIKFTKTPANLTKAIYDFSPAAYFGVAANAVAFKRAVKEGKATPKMQHNLAEAIGKATAGSLLYLAAVALASAGHLTGASDDDDDVAAYEKYIQGIPEYSMKLGKHWLSYDWLQPVGAVAAIVTELMEGGDEEAEGWAAKFPKTVDFYEAICAGGDVLFNQSFMSSIQKLFASDNFFENVVYAALGDISVPIPTLLSQTANLFDDKRRVTYDPTNPFKTELNRAKAKIPFLRNKLEAEIDIFGREVPNSQNNFYNAFINPANTFTNTSNEVTNHVYELYKSTGDVSAIPAKAPTYFKIRGVTKKMTDSERVEYQKMMGETTSILIESLLENDLYNELSDEDKLIVLKSVYQYSSKIAQSEQSGMNTYEIVHSIAPYIEKTEYDEMSEDEQQKIVDDYLLSSYLVVDSLSDESAACFFVNSKVSSLANAAMIAGNPKKVQEYLSTVEESVKNFGWTDDEASEYFKGIRSNTKSAITTYWKPFVINAYLKGKEDKLDEIAKMLLDTGLYGDELSKVEKTMKDWYEESQE